MSDGSKASQLHTESRNSTRRLFFANSHFFSPVLVFVLGLLLSLISFWQIHQSETLLLQEKLEKSAIERTKLLKRRFDFVLHELELLAESSKIVGEWDAEVFEQITETLMDNDPAVYAFEWVPVVSAEQRPEFEQLLKAEGASASLICEPNADGEMIPAADRPEYLPVQYFWPTERNSPAHGLDHGYWESRRITAQQARDSGKPAVTPRVPWVRDSKVKWALLAFAPVYSRGAVVKTAEQRRSALIGYAVAALDPMKLLTSASQLLSPSGIDYVLYEVGTEGASSHLAAHSSRLRDKPLDLNNLSVDASTAGLHSQQEFEWGGRQYRLLALPLPQFEANNRTAWPWIVAIFGLTFAILIAVLLRNYRNHNDSLSSAVRVRTQELELSAKHLHQSEAFSRLLLEHLAEGVVACNAEGELKLFNKTARAWHGTDPSKVPPEEWASYYDLFEADGVTPLAVERIPLIRAWQGETVVDASMSIVAKGQKPRLVLANGAPLFDEKGQKQGAIVTMHDITEQRKAQETASQMQRRFHDLFEFAPDAMIMVDHQGTIQLVNRRCLKLFGWTRNELVGQPVELLVPEDKRKPHVRLRDKFLRSPVNSSMGLTGSNRYALRKDGSLFPVEISLSPMETEEGPMVAAAVRDITDRLQQEQDRQALLVAKQANAAKSAFLATMSHEIRTPMNGVIGCVDLLARSSLKAHQMELVDTMRDSAFALLRVIDDILDFSKIEAGQLELEREPVSLERVVGMVSATMKQIAQRKGLQLDVFTDPALPPRILSDSVRLRQILNNLLSNAIKFSSGHGKSGQVSVRAELAGESVVRFTVADNGIGMTAEAQTRLFKPFVQAEASTTRRFGGSGLGLSICKRLVEMFEGHIEVESKPGQGSTFTVVIPIKKDVDLSPQSSEVDLSGVHCLVVTKDLVLAKNWRVYLEHAGAHVESFATKERAEQPLATLKAKCLVVLEEQATSALHWIGNLPLDPKPALVIVSRGQRRSQYMLEPGVTVLDGDALTRGAFLEAVATGVGLKEQTDEVTSNEHLGAMLSPPDRATAIEQGQLILVAEDNDINQKMIRRQLALLGYAADFFDNGRDALFAWRQGIYGLLLTDLHMPEMDGYELSRAIRDEEDSVHRIPIIAVTANALKEEAERCRAIGMDEYLTKPFVLEALKAKLETWLPAPSDHTEQQTAVPSMQQHTETGKSILDTRVLADLVGEEPELLEEFLFDFRNSAEEAAAQIRNAANGGDWETVGSVAHRLKSSSRAMGALALAECCQQLEDAGAQESKRSLKNFEHALYDVFSAIERTEKIFLIGSL